MSQPVPTTQDLLDDTMRCIQKVLVNGQEYSNALGREVKYAEIDVLYDLKSRLEGDIARETNGDTGVRVADFSEV